MENIDDRGNQQPTLRRGRRTFIVGAAGLAGLMASSPHAAALTAGSGGAGRVPFHGRHQAGILTPQQPFAAFVAFDVRCESRQELAAFFKKLTRRARALTTGLTPADPDVAALQGPQDRLTITVGVGASLFDERFGLASRKPAGLVPMPAFQGDELDEAACHGDLSLQICAQHPDAVLHVIRDLARETHGALSPRWRVDGFLNPPRPTGAPRTFIGFKDGIAHPDLSSSRAADRLLWLGASAGGPAWTRDGCFQVLRTIRLHAEAWDRVPIREQEKILGRHKATGAPLTGKKESDVPAYDADPDGRRIALDSHIRLANPRTPETADSQILRRSYNVDRGIAQDGTLDLGLLFCCYQQDIDRQFAAVQKRLEGERFADFTRTTGGGYFLTLPGVKDKADWFASGLLSV
ncbi:Dyp-type peroxidase [Streptomyces sp. NPDC055749]